MTGIQPGAYVRARGGMYDGATGRVVSVGQSASGPYATVDVGETQPIAVFVTGLELVGAVPTVEQERDAAIAERNDLLAIIHRDGGHYVGEHGITKAVADAHATWAAVVAERDRLRRELEALSREMRERYDLVKPRAAHKAAHSVSCEWADALDAILRGGES